MSTKTTQALDAWISWMRHNRGRSDGTLKKYRRYLEEVSGWLEAKGMTLFSVGREHLEEFAGPMLHSRGVSPRSRRPYVAAIRSFFQWASRADVISADPSRSMVYPNIGRKLPKGMTLQNAERLLQQPDLSTFLGVRDSAILYLFIGTGLRLAGLAALNESDLVFTESEGTEQLVIHVTEKGSKERILPVPSAARWMLQAYLAHPDLARINRELPNGKRVLFVSTCNRTVPEHEYFGENRRIAARTIQEMVESYAFKAGIPRDQAHPHALRHLYATELTEDDVSLLKLQTLLGHERAEDTKIYSHVAVRSLIKVVEASNPLAKIKTPVTDLARRLK